MLCSGLIQQELTISVNSKQDDAIKGITGRYQAGFFPIMMFGMPAAALAMYHTAESAQKNKYMVGL